jgi:DNA polymerase-3 subunit epsilon
MRQIVLDTETTGLDPAQGHRIIEIGCVEMINRRLTGNNYHQYINPDREIDQGAIDVHGITNEFLADKPEFTDVATDFLEYVGDAELIIHNAPFDIGFLDHELRRIQGDDARGMDTRCSVVDTLKMARQMHPGQKNDLDSLCKRYSVDNAQRTLHGALLDAEILADVYLAMTGGQTGLFEERRGPGADREGGAVEIRRLPQSRPPMIVLRATDTEAAAHEQWLVELDQASADGSIWRQIGLK